MANPFVITTAGETIQLGIGESGKVAFTVSNKTDKPLRGQLKLRPQGEAEDSWLKLEGESERDFEAKGSIQISVEIAPPEDAHVGRYEFRLDAASVENPDEEYTEGPKVIFELSESQPVVEEEEKKPFPWWIVFVGGGAALVMILVLILLLVLSGGTKTTDLGGLVGHWKLGASRWVGAKGEVEDSSGNNNTGSPLNGAQTVPYRNMYVGQFNGEGAYIDIPNSQTLQTSGSMTLCFWVYPQNIGAYRINPIDKEDEGEFSLVIEVGGNLSYYHGNSLIKAGYWKWTALPSGSLVNNTWHHIVIVRDAQTQTVQSYLNGRIKDASSYTGTAPSVHGSSTSPIKIGTGYANNNKGHFKGQLSDVRLYSRALSETEISQIYSSSQSQY